MLTACTAGLAGLEDEVAVLDLDAHVLHLGQNGHAGRRGLDAPLRLGRGYALNAVDARLEFESGERAVSLAEEGDLAEAAQLGLVCRCDAPSPSGRLFWTSFMENSTTLSAITPRSSAPGSSTPIPLAM